MALPKHHLNSIWRSGFCEKTVAMASGTTIENGQARIDWVTTHNANCEDCTKATLLKRLEYTVACRMGNAARKYYMNYKNVLELPGANAAMAEVLTEALSEGIITQDHLMWMAKIASRKDIDEQGNLEEDSWAP